MRPLHQFFEGGFFAFLRLRVFFRRALGHSNSLISATNAGIRQII
jgi:hypothetical protein